MCKFINKKFFIKIISLATIIIYLMFLYIDAVSKDLGNIYSLRLKYFTIILCFIISLSIASHGYSREDKFLVQLARFFTLIADYFLVISNNFNAGVFFFCLVQITYIIRHSMMEDKRYKNFIFFITALAAALIIALNIKMPSIDKGLIVLAFVYASLLTTSLYCSISTVKRGRYPKKASWIISLGMFLFFMCDLNVGLFNVIEDGNIKFFIGFLMWLFYVPSQLLLSLSGFKLNYLQDILNKG